MLIICAHTHDPRFAAPVPLASSATLCAAPRAQSTRGGRGTTARCPSCATSAGSALLRWQERRCGCVHSACFASLRLGRARDALNELPPTAGPAAAGRAVVGGCLGGWPAAERNRKGASARPRPPRHQQLVRSSLLSEPRLGHAGGALHDGLDYGNDAAVRAARPAATGASACGSCRLGCAPPRARTRDARRPLAARSLLCSRTGPPPASGPAAGRLQPQAAASSRCMSACRCWRAGSAR